MRPTSLRHRLIAMPLMGLVLGVSAAPVLSSMTCLMSGHHTLVVGSIDDCCPDGRKTDGPELTATCCEFDQAVPAKKEFRQEPTLALILVGAAMHLGPVVDIGSTVVEATAMPISRPPPLSVPLRLSRISLFLL